MTRLSSSSPRSSWLGGRFRSVLPSSRRGSISSSVPEKEISIGARWFSVERTLFGFSSSSSSRLRRKNKHASFEATSGRGTRLWEDGTTRLFVSSSLCVRGHATRHDRRGRVVLRSRDSRSAIVSVGESYIEGETRHQGAAAKPASRFESPRPRGPVQDHRDEVGTNFCEEKGCHPKLTLHGLSREQRAGSTDLCHRHAEGTEGEDRARNNRATD